MNLLSELARDEVVRGLARLEHRIRQAGVTRLAIFGSRARGDHRPDSDLDVLIEVAAEGKFSLLDLVGAAHIIEDELGVSANIFMKRSLSPHFADFNQERHCRGFLMSDRTYWRLTDMKTA